MQVRIRKIRAVPQHPLYPDLAADRAAMANGEHTALAGSLGELARAWAVGARARRAVFVLLYGGRPYFDERERDALWELFRAPIFGMLLDQDGRLVGYECEAQDGLHVVPGCAPPEGLMEAGPCMCGRTGVRLVPESQAKANAAD